MVHHLENHACFGQRRYIGVGTSELLFIFLAAIAGVCGCKAKLEQPDFWKSETEILWGTWCTFIFSDVNSFLFCFDLRHTEICPFLAWYVKSQTFPRTFYQPTTSCQGNCSSFRNVAESYATNHSWNVTWWLLFFAMYIKTNMIIVTV